MNTNPQVLTDNCMKLILSGHVRKQSLIDHARQHSGIVEHTEIQNFYDFLTTRNAGIVMNLKGADNP